MIRRAVTLMVLFAGVIPAPASLAQAVATSRRNWSPFAYSSAEANGLAVTFTSQPGDQMDEVDDQPLVPSVLDEPRWWVDTEYRYAWFKGPRVPALVTTSPLGTSVDEAGVLPSATVLYGGTRIERQGRPGGGVCVGYWLDDEQTDAIVLSWFSVGDGGGRGFSAESDGDPILARPFFNVDSGQEDAELVAFPEVLAGRVDAVSSSELHSIAAIKRWNWRRGPDGRIDWIVGYRYLRFRDGLKITENLVSTDPGGVVEQGTRFVVEDTFLAENDFHGGQLGVVADFTLERMNIEWMAGLAVGNLRRELTINGQTAVTTPGDPTVFRNGGLLALPTNIGHSTSNRVSLLPELRINSQIALAPSWDITIGYSLLYLVDVLQAGNNIDRLVNPTQLGPGGLVGPARPTAMQHDSSPWMHSLLVGLRFVR